MAEIQRGGVRNMQTRMSILTATRDLIAELGYDKVSIEAIARHAGVGKQTVYRWWASKNALLVDCVDEGMIMPEQLPFYDTGDIRHDLTEWLKASLEQLGDSANTSLLRALIAASASDGAVAAILYQRTASLAESSIARRLSVAVADGTLPTTAEPALIIEMLFGMISYRVLTRRETGPLLAEEIVSIIFGQR